MTRFDLKAPKSWMSRLAPSWSRRVNASSTLNRWINPRASSSTALPVLPNPKIHSPESSIRHSNPNPPVEEDVTPTYTTPESVEGAQGKAALTKVVSSLSDSSSSSSALSSPEEGAAWSFSSKDPLSVSFPPKDSQSVMLYLMNTYSSIPPSPSPPSSAISSGVEGTVPSFPSRDLRSPILYPLPTTENSQAEAPCVILSYLSSRAENIVSSFSSNELSARIPPPPTAKNSQEAAKTTSERSAPDCLLVMKLFDELDLGKYMLGFAITMGVGMMFSSSKLAQGPEIHVVAIALPLSIPALINGLLLRGTFKKTSTVLLVLGSVLVLLAISAFFACFLTSYKKLIPPFSFLASLIAFAMYSWAANFRKEKAKDLERGEIN